jgi:hypothetical protein
MSPPLREQDGAKFCATVVEADGQYRACYAAHRDHGSGITQEEPQYRMFKREAEARAWVDQQAAARGFTKITWEAPVE